MSETNYTGHILWSKRFKKTLTLCICCCDRYQATEYEAYFPVGDNKGLCYFSATAQPICHKCGKELPLEETE